MNQSKISPFLERISPAHHHLFTGIDDVVRVPQSFTDSTHALWSFQLNGEGCFLKLCNIENNQLSQFWQLMKQLFSLDLPVVLDRYSEVYQQVAQLSGVKVPELIAAVSNESVSTHDYSGFLLSDFVQGSPLGPKAITDQHVKLLALHITSLHQSCSVTSGPLFSKSDELQISVDQWRKKLKATLLSFEDESLGSNLEFNADLVDKLVMKDFQIIMPDLRWDQFLQLDDGRLALVDLDAFVWGPKALELVLLEYLLNAEQAELFKTIYCQVHVMPDLTIERQVYRFLLFKMNVLGVSDLGEWMSHPIRF